MIYILGHGGHAKVCADVLRLHGLEHKCVTTDEVIPERAILIMGIGDLDIRKKLFVEYLERYWFWKLTHPSAIVAFDIRHGLGFQIMAGAIIQPGCHIGHNVLINTGAQIDHDCIIGHHCHIAPGAVLCGEVIVGEGSFIGAGAIIPEGRKIPSNAFVPAGTVFK